MPNRTATLPECCETHEQHNERITALESDIRGKEGLLVRMTVQEKVGTLLLWICGFLATASITVLIKVLVK